MTPTTRPWYIDELEKHWGEGVMSFDTRRASKTAIDQVEALTKERDALAAAGKLAMDALVYDTRDPMSKKDLARVLTAITALRQAGVQ